MQFWQILWAIFPSNDFVSRWALAYISGSVANYSREPCVGPYESTHWLVGGNGITPTSGNLQWDVRRLARRSWILS